MADEKLKFEKQLESQNLQIKRLEDENSKLKQRIEEYEKITNTYNKDRSSLNIQDEKLEIL